MNESNELYGKYFHEEKSKAERDFDIHVAKQHAQKLESVTLASTSVNNIQHGGNHYKKYGDLQPWDVVIKWNLGYLEGTALKYIARWRDKGGIEDIKKAIHFLQKLVEVEEEKNGLRGGS